jgi:hypothetical protein
MGILPMSITGVSPVYSGERVRSPYAEYCLSFSPDRFRDFLQILRRFLATDEDIMVDRQSGSVQLERI